MPKVFTSKTQKIGEIGENLACLFLMKHGFSIIERNYTRKWGEIDIVAQNKKTLHFIEVKSIRKNLVSIDSVGVTRESFDPMSNMHPVKIKKFLRTVEIYLSEKSYSGNFSIDVALVYIDENIKKGKVELLEGVL